MKMLTLSLLFIFTIIPNAHAIDQGSIDALVKKGFQVRMGELTGAGSKMSLARVAGFIHPNGIVMKSDCKSIAIAVGSDASNPQVSDVTKVVVDQSVLKASEFEGFFTNQ
jgi:hypothetical protein